MAVSYKAKIAGTGRYLPRKVLTNADLEKIVDTSDEWIRSRTGMQERHLAGEGEASSDMAVMAAIQAIEAARLRPRDIDMIVVGTVTADHAYPSTACIVQKKLGLKNIPAFDVSAGCTGFIYAADIARQYVEGGMAQNVLTIGVELLTRVVNWQDRNTCVLFGDGAGAAVITRAQNHEISQFIDSYITADGSNYEWLIQPAGGSAMPASQKTVQDNLHTVHMEGNRIFKNAVRYMYDACDVVLKRNNLDFRSLDWLIPHQANLRIIEALGEKTRIPENKVVITIEKYANTSAATIPIALDECIRSQKIRRGDLVLMVSFGAGFTSGSLLIRI